MEKKLLVSRIQTPDGTILTSRHTHDYVTYTDKNGLEYFLDGGNDYQRCSFYETAQCINVSIYTDSPFEEIRKYYCRGSRGVDGTEPLKYIPLCEMTDEHIKNSIIYNYENGLDLFCVANMYYMQELIYRRSTQLLN